MVLSLLMSGRRNVKMWLELIDSDGITSHAMPYTVIGDHGQIIMQPWYHLSDVTTLPAAASLYSHTLSRAARRAWQLAAADEVQLSCVSAVKRLTAAPHASMLWRTLMLQILVSYSTHMLLS